MPVYTDQVKRPQEEHEYTIDQIKSFKTCSEDILYFLKYIKIVHPDKGRVVFDPYEYQKKLFKLLVEERFVACLMARQMGKDLDITTPIPTRTGWKSVGELNIGDVIFGSDGKQTIVTDKSKVYTDRKCYEIEFDTGEKIVSSYTHLWNVKHPYWKNKKTCKIAENTLETEEIYNLWSQYENKSFFIDLPLALDLPEIALPIPPYIVGVLLGNICNGNDTTQNNNIFKDNHIPDIYFRSSIKQRVELLKGVVATCGVVNGSGICEIHPLTNDIMEQIIELISSLGIKCYKQHKINNDTKYTTISFYTSKYNLFKIKKKHNHIDHTKNNRLYIKNIKEVKPRKTQCITVNNDSHLFLCGRSMIPTHNSLSVGAYALWYALFNNDKVIGIVSNKESSAIDFLSRIKLMYEELPGWLKCGVVEYNKKTIIFENGTMIVAGATSKNAFRGKTANIIISDELAFVEGDKAEDFYMSNYPTISVSKYGKFIAISTPNGIGGLFYELYTGAEKGNNEFVHYRVDWREHPDRDDEWARIQLNNIKQRRFDQEYNISFLGSTSTVIDKNSLLELENKQLPDPISVGMNGNLKIYEKPVQGNTYILGGDPSKGTGEHDASIQVLKILSIKPFKVKQVAVFSDNHTDTHTFAYILHNLSTQYNNGYIMIENNGEGSAVIQTLWWEIECENLINEGSKISKLGIRATKKTKPIAVLLMKKLIEDGCVDLVDFETIKQLTAFIDKGNNRFMGDGYPDDRISALYWGLYFMKFDILEESAGFISNKTLEDDVWEFLSDRDDEEDGYEILQRW